MSELVSVIIPTYKRPETLERAINSVLNQDYSNVEVIVADDNGIGTEYGLLTEAVMKAYSSDLRVKYVQHEKNINGSAARNTGFRASSGEYIMYLDDDDEFLPCKVSLQVNKLKSLDESWGACYTMYSKVSQDGSRVLATSRDSCEGDLLLEQLKRNLFIAAGSNLMVRRAVVDEIGGFDEKFLRNQDQEFLVKILLKYKIACVPEVGLKIYAHARPRRKETFDEITEKYLESFSFVISSLDEADREKIYRYIDLQRFRAFLTSKKLKSAFALIFEKKVSVFGAVKYFVHLCYRRIFRIDCGFKL